MSSKIETEQRDDGVFMLTLNRPDRRNAFDEAMVAEIVRILSHAADDDEICALILQGTGGHFCAGFDLKSRPRLPAEQGIGAVAEMYRLLTAFPALTVALIDGPAYGGGVGLVAACDMAIATCASRFACPEVRHGIVPSVMGHFLADAIGVRRATVMIATGEPITAERACTWGLVTETVDDAAGLEVRAAELAGAIGQSQPAAIRETKRLLRKSSRSAVEEVALAETVAASATSTRRRWAEARSPKATAMGDGSETARPASTD